MIKRIFLVCFCLLSLFLRMTAQTDSVFFQERVFIAPTNTCFNQGDVVQVIGQVLSSEKNAFRPYSQYVYVEMFDTKNRIVKRQKVRCSAEGKIYATLPIADDIIDGTYYIRGYTQFMRNLNKNSYPNIQIYIGREHEAERKDTAVCAMFFPEGGHLVRGKLQNLCIYMFNATMNPLQTDYCVVKNENDTIVYGSTNNFGLSSFSFIPESGSQYNLCLKGGLTFSLPSAEQKPTLNVSVNKKRLVCNILYPDGLESEGKFRLFAFHHTIGLKEFSIDDNYAVADLAECPPGLITIWLVDKNGEEVAQRVVCIGNDNVEHIDENILVNSTFMAGDSLTVTFPEKYKKSNVFVHFTPVTYKENTSAQFILGFGNELFSPVPFPSFAGHNGHMTLLNSDLNSWLTSARQTMTMRVKNLISKGKLSYPYPIERGFCISGNVAADNGPIKNASVQVLNTSTGFAATTSTDSCGCFVVPVADYDDGTRFFLQAYNQAGKAGQYYYSIDEYDWPDIPNLNSDISRSNTSYPLEHAVVTDTFADETTHNIDEVVVKAKAVNKKIYNWAKVKSADFFDRDYLNSHSGWQTIRDAIVFTNKIGVTNDNSYVYWKSGRYSRLSSKYEMSSDGVSQIGFAVNGFYINRIVSDILDIQLSDVESIELVYPIDGRSRWHGASNGFFDIKLRSLTPAKFLRSNGVIIQPLGLSVPTIPYECRMPEKSGNYRMVIDVISPDGHVASYVKDIIVH